jgi:uncharacterized protein
MIIDFHAHAFPDNLADKAMNALQQGCDIKPFHDGKIISLLKSMDSAGIDKAVICSIATKPDQFQPILEWSKTIKSDRIIPFLSIHPNDEKIKEKVKIIFNEGFKGIKLHPYYQGFSLDDEKIFPLYEESLKHNLIIISHCGFDIAFPKDRLCDPDKIINIKNKFPDLKFVASHFGSWQDWYEVEKKIIGKDIYLESSFSIELIGGKKSKELILKHPSDYILFGTDSPWTNQQQSVKVIRSLKLPVELQEKIFCANAKKLLNL